MTPDARKEVLAPGGTDTRIERGVGPGAEAEGDPTRPVDPLAVPAEEADEAGLRPHTLSEFVGQGQLTEHLRIVIEAAIKRDQPADHLLFAGPPGLGKTSLAGIVAAELGAGLRVTSGPVLVRAGDLAALLTDLQEGDVLFIDEIHRMHRSVEEILYPAMEDFKLDILMARARRPAASASTFPGSPWSVPPPGPGWWRGRCGTASGSSVASISTTPVSSSRSSCAPPASWACPSTSRGPGGSPNARGARRVSPTGCSAGSATLSRYGPRARSPPRPPSPVSRCSAWTNSASTRSTGPSSTSCACGSRADRWGSPLWPSASARSRTPSRTLTSPTCSNRASCSGPPGAGWPGRERGPIWA